MKKTALSILAIGGVLVQGVTMGCNGENPVGPQEQETYEAAVFGTFRGISAFYRGSDSTVLQLDLDSTSYIEIEKSDSSYSMNLHGTDKRWRTLDFSFEEVGQILVRDVSYTAAHGYSIGYWVGRLMFTPDPALRRSPWTLRFTVSDYSTGRKILTVSGNSCSIYLPQEHAYLSLVQWRPQKLN
jgi:hypothetical protein